MAIVYKHTRQDTNQIFYVGISVNDKRAFNKSQRNKIWKGIVSRTNYNVEILFENLTWEELLPMGRSMSKRNRAYKKIW